MSEEHHIQPIDLAAEAKYGVQRNTVYAVIKGGLETFAEAISHSISPQLAQGMSGVAAGFGGVAGLLTVGLTAALSAGLTEMDFKHKKERLRDMYREEIAEKYGKPRNKVSIHDLDRFAKENRTLGEEMQRSRRQRNFGMVLSFAASLAALSVVTIAVAPALITMGLAGHGIGIGAMVAGMAIKGAVGLMVYHAVKDPLHYLANKFFDIDVKTTNDHIVGMKHDRAAGKIISREQVVGTFVESNQALGEVIEREYGKKFHDLNLGQKQMATEEVSRLLPIDRLTQDINSGRVNVTEMAFAVDGNISGVYHTTRPAPEPKPSRLKAMWQGISQKFGQSPLATDVKRVVVAATAPEDDITQINKTTESPMRPFVERLGLVKRNPDNLSHVERLEQSRAAAAQQLGIQQP